MRADDHGERSLVAVDPQRPGNTVEGRDDDRSSSLRARGDRRISTLPGGPRPPVPRCLRKAHSWRPEALPLIQKAVSLEPVNSTSQLELAQVLSWMENYEHFGKLYSVRLDQLGADDLSLVPLLSYWDTLG